MMVGEGMFSSSKDENEDDDSNEKNLFQCSILLVLSSKLCIVFLFCLSLDIKAYSLCASL